MQARRILLFFGIVLLLTAAAASFIPVPEQASQDGEESAPPAADRSPPSFQRAGDDAVEISFGTDGRSRDRTVRSGTRVIATVEAGRPGQIELQGLGRIQPVEPGTPAVFDLFTDEPGSFEVVYTPVEGEAEALGTLVVRPPGEPAPGAT